MIVSFVAVLATVSALHAATLTVGPNGQYRDIQSAVDKAKSGDTISVAAGTYNTDGPIRIEGKHNLTITANGEVSVVCSDMYANIFEISSSDHVTITGLTVGHEETPECEGDVIYVFGSRNVTVQECDLYGCGVVGVDFNFCTNAQVLSNSLHDNSFAGISIYACSDITVKDNTFTDNVYHFSLDFKFYKRNGSFPGNVLLKNNTFNYSEAYTGAGDGYQE